MHPVLPPRAPGAPSLAGVAVLCDLRGAARIERVAVGPAGIWVLGTTLSGPPGRFARARLRRQVRSVRGALAASAGAYARTPVRALVTLPDVQADERLLADGTLAAGPAGTLDAVARGDLHDVLDVRAICELLAAAFRVEGRRSLPAP